MPSVTDPIRNPVPRILILGGTTEASVLATHLAARADLAVISSLAGRTSQPRLPPGIVRVGGFGGPAGLVSYLTQENIAVVIDATHPYAAKISTSAEQACHTLGLPLLALDRPPWSPLQDDSWCTVPDLQAAASSVNHPGNRVFLSIGRQEVQAFSDCHDAWFLVRAIDPPTGRLPPRSELVLNRGPFHRDRELQLLRSESINLIVSKNSGGMATYSKIEAARELRIPVVMIARPAKHTLPTLPRPEDILQKLSELLQTTPQIL